MHRLYTNVTAESFLVLKIRLEFMPKNTNLHNWQSMRKQNEINWKAFCRAKPFVRLVMNQTFECLHFLDNHSISILEICESAAPAPAKRLQVLRWLLIDKKNRQVKLLRSKAIDSAHQQGERYFDLGYLNYNHRSGTFIEGPNAFSHELDIGSCDHVPQDILSMVQHFLLSTTELSEHSSGYEN